METQEMNTKPIAYMNWLAKAGNRDKEAVIKLLQKDIMDQGELAYEIMELTGDDEFNKKSFAKAADIVLEETAPKTEDVVGPKQMTDDQCRAFDFRNTPSLRKERDANEESIIKWKEERDVFAVSNENNANVERIRRDVRIEEAEGEIKKLNQILAYRKLQTS